MKGQQSWICNLYEIMYQLATKFTTVEISVWFPFDSCMKELWDGVIPLVWLIGNIKCVKCKNAKKSVDFWAGSFDSLDTLRGTGALGENLGTACVPDQRLCRGWEQQQQRGSFITFSPAMMSYCKVELTCLTAGLDPKEEEAFTGHMFCFKKYQVNNC